MVQLQTLHLSHLPYSMGTMLCVLSVTAAAVYLREVQICTQGVRPNLLLVREAADGISSD